MKGVVDNAVKMHLLSDNLFTDVCFGLHWDHMIPDHIAALIKSGKVRVTAFDINADLKQSDIKKRW